MHYFKINIYVNNNMSKKSKAENIRRRNLAIALLVLVSIGVGIYFIVKNDDEDEVPPPDSPSNEERIRECTFCGLGKCTQEIVQLNRPDQTPEEILISIKDYSICTCSKCYEECIGIDSLQGITEEQCDSVN
jgi:hypothetical protein